MTDLDKQLQEIAIKDWQQFVAIVGEDAVINAKVCILRQNNKSYAKISIKLGITPKLARYRSGKCHCESVETLPKSGTPSNLS